jgi:hypothetical protein
VQSGVSGAEGVVAMQAEVLGYRHRHRHRDRECEGTIERTNVREVEQNLALDYGWFQSE